MPLSADISTALHLLEHVQERVEDCDDPKLQMHTSQDLKALITLLEDPVFRSIVTIQDSLTDLNTQLGHHPSILPGDFDINLSGKLELSLPNTPVQSLGPNIYQDLNQDTSELEDQRVPVAQFVHSSSEDTSAQVTSPSLVSDDMGMPPITTPTYAKEFQKVIEAAAKGRQVYTVQLYKPEGTSLGFSVVGLRSKDKGELGIFLQEVQPNGIAGCDGRLVEGDQILAIDGQPLDSNISHEQAISILQKARGLVELVVARSAQDVGSSLPTDELSGASSSTAAAGGQIPVVGAGTTGNQAHSDREQSLSISSIVTPVPTTPSLSGTTTAAATPVSTPAPTPTPTLVSGSGGLVVERSPSAVSDTSKTGSDMVLNTEWAQVEVINLINDGSGLGFGIIGGRSTGVVVKTILPGGVADRDNRLQSGDHILQIGDVNLRGMGSEQVAAVLRQSGTHVRLVVARPVEPTSPDYQALGSHAPIVPTKILGDPDELERHLVHSVPENYNPRHLQGDSSYDNGYAYSQEPDIEMHARPGLIMDVVRNPVPISAVPVIPAVPIPAQIQNLPILSMETLDVNSLPEMERFTVELKKDIYGLGITIAGYVCEKEELSGIFVKSISEGSAADLSNKIQINDRIVEVDGHSLQGYSNHEAVEVLRSTGQIVTLCLERYLRGPKYEQLQQAIAASELRPPQPGSPSITSLPSFPISADGETTTEIEPEGESHTTMDSAVLHEGERESVFEDLDGATNVEALLSDPSSELTSQIRAAIKSKWQKIVGPDTEIVVAQLKKFAEGSGLGISLEGTVDVEDGQEVRPHHYIRSILPEGPVGQNGILRSGDELLEVNGYRLLGINHMEVVSVLKELPIHVRMVCGRNTSAQDPLCPIDTAQHQAAFQTRSILGGSLQNLLPAMDRLVKAKSDGSLASTTTTATVTDASLSKMKSRSLEPLTGLAMWSSEPQIIELIKGERGLGFSILDYQDPMNPNETVIVIRSLVPGGVAQVDGQLIPGDRLLFVNDIALENATLDQAVQALKGAPKGTVRIGVAKPLPIPDSIAQLVTPICIVRRTRSLPDDSEATDRAVNLDDFPSSRSGISCSSMDRPEAEDNDEVECFEDASPITPVHSPKKSPIPSPIGEESSEKSGPSAVVPQASLEKDTAPLRDSVVPQTAAQGIKPDQVWSDPERSFVIATLATLEPPEDDASLSLEQDPSGIKSQENEEATLLDDRIAYDELVQEEKHARTTGGPTRDSIVKDTGPSTSRQKIPLNARKKDVQGQRDLVKKKVPGKERNVERASSTSNLRGTTLKSKDAIQRRSSVKKEEEERKKKNGELSKTADRKTGKSTKSREHSNLELISKAERAAEKQLITQVKEDEEKRSVKETNESARKLAKERRKSLKEQESIDRVTKFLKEQNVSGSFESKKSIKEPCRLSKQKSIERTTDPAVAQNSEEDFGREHSLTIDAGSSTSADRRKSLTKQENVETILESPEHSFPNPDHKFETKHEFGDKLSFRGNLEKASSLKDEDEAEPKKMTGRRSSMKKRESSRSLDRKSNRPLSPANLSKKEVKIQDDVQEIFYEDLQDQVTILPEVQLVRARIISMEEAAASLTGRMLVTRTESPPEVVVVLDKVEARSKVVRAVVSDEAGDRELQLQPPRLSKSASEVVLAVVKEENEENKISEKNIKPEILLDLSKVTREAEVPLSSSITRNVSGSTKEKWLLNRVSSEGSEKFLEVKSLVACHSGLVVDDERVSNSFKPLGDGALSLTAKPESVTGVNEDVGANVGDGAEVNVVLDVTLDKHGCVDDSRSSTETAACVERSLEKVSSILRRTQSVREQRTISSTYADPVSFSEVSLEKSDSNPIRVIPRTLVQETDLPSRKTECIYKSVDQRLREKSTRSGALVSRSVDSLSPKKPLDDPKFRIGVDEGPEGGQLFTTDKEAEEPRQEAVENQREHEKKFLPTERPSEEGNVYVRQPEDDLIGQQHSLQYQSQTLETRSKHFAPSTTFEDLLESIAGNRTPDSRALRSPEEDFKVVEGSPVRDRREVETQTHQETKSTQCGPDGSPESPLESSRDSPFECSHKYSGSPRREVETQTQGESKSTQCCQNDLEDNSAKESFHNGSLTLSLRGTLSGPRKEAQVQTEQESKSVQCIPEDIPEDSPLRSSIFFRRSLSQSQKSLDSLRREVEVQTYQETKSTQCSSDEFSDSPQRTVLKGLSDPYSLTSESGQAQRSIDGPSVALDNSESSSGSSPHKFPIIVLVEGRKDMTVTHGYRDKDRNVVWAKHWGPERLVEIYREPKSSLGLSIVGGKVDLYNGGPSKTQNISGIFIKNVLPNSPAGRTGELKTGDRIIEVDGIDLRNSTHERAVGAIQAAGNPVCFLVQSLVHLSAEDERQMQETERDGDGAFRRQNTRNHEVFASDTPGTPTTSFRHKPLPVSPARTVTPELIQEGIEDDNRSISTRSDLKRQSINRESDGAGPSSRRSSMRKSLQKRVQSPPKNSGILREVSEERDDQPTQKEVIPKQKYSSDESSDEEDTRDLEGNVYTKAGIEISRKSAGNVKRTREEIEADPEQEDEFGYTTKKIKKRYDCLGHTVVMIKLEKDRRGLGISLAGHKDRNRMAVFVCGLNPKGVAHKTGGLHIGDEILEVNGTVLQGRCHLNASALIKGMPGPCFKVIVLRRSSAVNDLAVKPIVQFPPTLDEDDANRFSQYKGVHTVSIKKGQYGLGIMIIEGKHAEVGQGIFVSDIQEGSAAEQAGLQVGDMILAVNLDSLLGSSYDEATGLLKKTEGVVTLTVCNPNQSKLAKEEEERSKRSGDASEADQAKSTKEPEKPKEPEPPKDPKDCEILIGKETTIEFPKDKDKGIGFSIAGGSDTPLGGVVITEVFPDGAAGKDGRLKAGDEIIEMCHGSFKAIEHAKAHEAILKANGTIHMIVFRGDKPPEEYDVELQKKTGKGAGLCLTGFKSGKGANVSEILPGSSAMESGKIAKGDRVIGVNGQNVREATVEDIALHVKVSNPVQLKLARYKPAKQ